MGNRLFSLCLSVSLCWGCFGRPKPPASSIRDFTLAQNFIYAKKANETQGCVDETGANPESERVCLARVEKRWARTTAFLRDMRALWCNVKPDDCKVTGPEEAPPEALAEAAKTKAPD